MATSLERLADGVFLYVWEGRISLADIRSSMDPQLHAATHVLFDLSGMTHIPVGLTVEGAMSHRVLRNLKHVYLVYNLRMQAWSEFLLKSTVRTPSYSLHLSREEAMRLLKTEFGGALQTGA